jgi:hypothetical protein
MVDELGPELEAILAKDDTSVMLDELRRLFGDELDVDSRFTIAQVMIAMEDAHKQAVEFMETVHRAQAVALTRTPPEVSEEMVERIDAVRESLRVTMLEQPITGERRTYSDGFAMGLSEAIRRIDRALKEAGQ